MYNLPDAFNAKFAALIVTNIRSHNIDTAGIEKPDAEFIITAMVDAVIITDAIPTFAITTINDLGSWATALNLSSEYECTYHANNGNIELRQTPITLDCLKVYPEEVDAWILNIGQLRRHFLNIINKIIENEV